MEILTEKERRIVYFQLGERIRQLEHILTTLDPVDDKERIQGIYKILQEMNTITNKMI